MKPMTFITPTQSISCPRFFRSFSLEDVQSTALCITGLGLYCAYLNGQRVGEDYLTPGFNDYDAWLPVREYDVTKLLKAGDNALEVFIGDGWYKGRIGLDGGQTDTWGKDYLLAARLTANGKTLLETDDSWQASPSPTVLSGIYDGEVRDDTREHSPCVPCKTVEAAFPQELDQAPPVRACKTLSAMLLTTPKGESVLDFGQNVAGIVRFHSRMKRGETLALRFGEVLQDGCFYRDNLRSAKAEFIYTSDGVEKDVEPRFTFYGFRYVLVEGLAKVDPADFIALALSSQLPLTLHCETSIPKLDRLMENALWGQRSNFLTVPTDCPQRDERLGWTADAQVFCRTAMYQMDCRAFYRKFIRDMRVDQVRYYNGDVPMYSPSLRGQAGHGGAVWADAGVIIPWELYQTYGDVECLRESWPLMHDYVQTLIATDEKLGGSHICFDSFTFGDWLALDGITAQSLKGGTDDAYIQAVYYMHAVGTAAKAAQVLSLNDEQAHFEALEKEIRCAILDEYVTPGGNLSVDTQTGYVLALYYGLWRDKEKLLQGFKKRLSKDGYMLKSGFTGTPLMLPVLFDNGMEREAYSILLREEFPGWLYAVNLGATTIWERWNSLLPDGTISGTGMNSLNHYAYGSVCEAIYSRIAGLRTAVPGWRKAIIAPQPNGRLKQIALSYTSPAGLYETAWQIHENGQLQVTITIPDGCTAEVHLPDHPEQSAITLNAGHYEYSYTPTVDYLHPLSVHSLIMDILISEEGTAILREHVPALYGAVSAPDSEFRASTPMALAYQMPYLNPEEVLAIDPLLRGVRI